VCKSPLLICASKSQDTPCVHTVHFLPYDIALPIIQLSVAQLQQLVSERGEGDVDLSGDARQQEGQQRWRTMFGHGGARRRMLFRVPEAGEGELS
jgi:hypothetical protein